MMSTCNAKHGVSLLLSVAMTVACTSMPNEHVSYVAIGDSYTEGTGVASSDAWPTLLVNDLANEGYDIDLTANLGKSGWTSADALEAQLPRFIELNPDFATLFIGANDVFQNVPLERFESNLVMLIEGMLSSLPSNDRLVIMTIPDYSLTPAGMVYGRGRDIAAELDAFNGVIESIADEYDLHVADIHDTSKKFVFDIGLISEDKLHPSERGHELWLETIKPVVKRALSD